MKKFLPLISISLSCSYLSGQEMGPQQKNLDAIALETGTDKNSSYHNYTPTYETWLSPLRNQPIRFLEIGISRGKSVKMWEEYFPLADLHFIDISPAEIGYWSKRSHYHFLDQGNYEAMRGFGLTFGQTFDVIIDDGGHLMHQQVRSFKALFPFLKSGGLYIVEDLHTSYWRNYGGGGTKDRPKASTNSMVAFLQQLVHPLNVYGARTGCADSNKTPLSVTEKFKNYEGQIESIHFYPCFCIIVKK